MARTVGKPRRVGVKAVAKPVTARKRRQTPHRFVRQVAAAQRGVDVLIQKLPFARLCREIMQTFDGPCRIQASALEALQSAAEAHLIARMERAYDISLHCGRRTLMAKDMMLERSHRTTPDAARNLRMTEAPLGAAPVARAPRARPESITPARGTLVRSPSPAVRSYSPEVCPPSPVVRSPSPAVRSPSPEDVILSAKREAVRAEFQKEVAELLDEAHHPASPQSSPTRARVIGF
jgi:histone H3